jgi:hypothetical protein
MVNFCPAQKFENVALDKLLSPDVLFGAVRNKKCDFKLEVIGCRKDDYLIHLPVCLNPSNSLF